MIHYITGLGQVWIGSRPPLNQAYNILWLKPADTKGFWELRIFNQSANLWDLVITASADAGLVAKVEAIEAEQQAISLKLIEIDGKISLLEETALIKNDIVQEEGNNQDKIISQDAVTKLLQKIRASIPDLNAHNTSSSAHEDIRNLIEENSKKINTNTTNITKSVILPTYNSGENSLSFTTQGGDSLKVDLGSSGGEGIKTVTITDFKEVITSGLYNFPKGTLFNVLIDNSNISNFPYIGQTVGTSTGIGCVAANTNPGNSNTALTIDWIISNKTFGLIFGSTTAVTTSAVSVYWKNTDVNKVVVISDFKDTSWVTDNLVGEGEFVFIQTNTKGIPNGPTDNLDFYTGYAQVISVTDDNNKLIKFLIQSYSSDIDNDKLFSGTLRESSGIVDIKWKEIGAGSSNNTILKASTSNGGPYTSTLSLHKTSGEGASLNQSIYFDQPIQNKNIKLEGVIKINIPGIASDIWQICPFSTIFYPSEADFSPGDGPIVNKIFYVIHQNSVVSQAGDESAVYTVRIKYLDTNSLLIISTTLNPTYASDSEIYININNIEIVE